jgi:hypothetical protein
MLRAVGQASGVDYVFNEALGLPRVAVSGQSGGLAMARASLARAEPALASRQPRG